jgi:DNA repair exonuclease SbcCD ATPase subunit
MNLMPVELEIKGFRSFSERALIKFPEIRRGAILINGKYKDKTTSSGSGKSSILMAMAFALDFCDVPATDLKSWYSKEMYVRFRLSDGTNIYDIIRNPKLSLIINGNEYQGTATGAKEKLQEILKTSPELVKTLTYRPQRQKGFFLSNTDSENKEFLTQVLNLEQIEEASNHFSTELSSITSQNSLVERDLANLNANLASYIVDNAAIEKAKAEVLSATARVEALSSSSESLMALKQEMSLVENEINKMNQVDRSVQSAESNIAAIKQRAMGLKQENEVLSKGICHTCKQEWNKSMDKIESNQREIRSLVEEMKKNNALIENAAPLRDPTYRNAIMQKRSDLAIQMGSLSSSLSEAVQNKNTCEYYYSNLLKTKQNYALVCQQIEAKKAELDKNAVKLQVYTHCAKLLDRQGFLGNIFDEVLQEIKTKTNDMLAYIPNINTFSLDISSSSVTQKGKVNKKIKTMVYKNGEETSLKTLSGGQLSSAELCTDLAVAETVRLRSGSNLGWMALDEAMDGLDVETKMAALDVIKSKIDGLLIVVDHSTEIKEAFDMVIEVEYDGRDSYVV